MFHIHASENTVTKIVISLKFLYYPYENAKPFLSKDDEFIIELKKLQETKIKKEEKNSCCNSCFRDC